MSGVPRSQKFFSYGAVAGGSAITFTCPAGYTMLVKSANFSNVGASANYYLFRARDAVRSFEFMVKAETLQPNTFGSWEGWLVLHPGDALDWYGSDAGMEVWASGTLLLGDPQFPPATRDAPAVKPSM